MRGRKRKQAAPAVVVASEALSCPDWLDPDARLAWDVIVPELERLGMLGKIQWHQVVCYCQAWAEFKAATQTLQQEGRTVTNAKSGLPHSHPAVQQQRTAMTHIRAFAERYGLDPSSLGRMNVKPTPTESNTVKARKRE